MYMLYIAYATVHHVLNCMSCHKAIMVITIPMVKKR